MKFYIVTAPFNFSMDNVVRDYVPGDPISSAELRGYETMLADCLKEATEAEYLAATKKDAAKREVVVTKPVVLAQ